MNDARARIGEFLDQMYNRQRLHSALRYLTPDWGFPIEETAAKLPGISENVRERVQLRDEGYLLITSQNAAAAVERNALKRGRG